MPTPSLRQARSHHARQLDIAAKAVAAVRGLVNGGRGWSEILNTVAQYQLASATRAVRTMAAWSDSDTPLINPRPFAGVSSAGFGIAEPIIATIDQVIPAPVEALPPPWWEETAGFLKRLEQLIESEVQDAGRSAAQAEMVMRPGWDSYVRLLVPPSCKRCVQLAGKIYRDLDGFDRHPGDDCVHVPVGSWEEAHDIGLVSSPMEAFEKGYIRDLTAAEQAAIEDGADISQVINASSGIYTADLFGRRVKGTRYGSTARAGWRKRNPSKRVRLRPETIYKIADGDRTEVQRLLRLYGYMRADDTNLAGIGQSGGGSAGRPPGGIGAGVNTPDDDDQVARTARELISRAAATEPEVTAAVRVEAAAVGAALSRLDSRLKTVDSLTRKLRTESADGAALSVVAADMKDVLRYTAVASEADYWRSVDDLIRRMVARGYRLMKDPGGWRRHGYRGLNLAFELPDGFTFELQVHTHASLAAAESAHLLYEEARADDTTAQRAEELDRAMQELFESVTMPAPPRWVD
ncbi:hypothetical protein [Nocardioides sp. LHG3406-4]|uniref:hypothetical protein n=1 Tax=Nocardioides sp. LHG3406-4 TaxID=2804575 RepID=UPI003CE8EA65